ncbi:MAG: aspartyl protease family protein [Prosthecobacter sp.]|uniref:aspartyl protease family protein n=1 Tax=Prosthecobacter sp. TaxID=1965333 RepID=UPI0038FFC695
MVNGLPLVDVRIGHSDAHREQCERNLDPVPPDIQVKALLDTGASITVMDADIVRRLRLRDRGVCRVRGFDGSLHADPASREYLNYDISLTIPDASGTFVVRIGDLQSVGVPMGCDDYQVLLGLDVLSRCTVTLRFAEGEFDIVSAA